MTKPTAIPKRWRPRFSLRTLVLFMTLVCVYFGAWEATKRYGVGPEPDFISSSLLSPLTWNESSPAPFIIGRDEGEYESSGSPTISRWSWHRRYYLWLFGPEIQWPFESNIDQPKFGPMF